MIEKYVVSLDLAKKLKEAGWEKKTEFIWTRGFVDLSAFKFKYEGEEVLPAPLAEEITKELPDHITIEKDGERKKYWLNIEVYKEGCRAGYRTDPVTLGEMPEWLYVSDVYPKLSDALAQLWLWAYENGYLEEKDEQA
ncbi:MAG: hypothetical protein DRP09_21410 [Candidatus Thorarchaeota archaeon]|nr:MAG: hypothetical protein DRP09_21410 [Candidatus Thorarchaeota archaeon]